jgi:transposase
LGDNRGMSSAPISPEQIASLPPEFRAILQAVIDHYEARVAKLEVELAQMRAELAETRKDLAEARKELAEKKNPRNSSLPPSSEHPHAKPVPEKKPSGRKRGGQPGHPRHERTLLPTEQCQAVVKLKPEACRRCGSKLTGSDETPLRHQVWELPEIKPEVTEYQRHRLACRCCGETTCAPLPVGVPACQAGPRLIALVALLMGCFRQSKSRVALFLEQVLGQPCSTGWVVKLQNHATAALRPAYEHLVSQLPEQEVLGVDESPTKEATSKAWLWTCVASAFTVFALRTTRAATVLTELLGDSYDGVVGCDRAKMYYQLPRLQWCWAHLKRDFQALIDSRNGVKKRLGHDLMRPTRKLFKLWARYRDGTLTRVGFQRLMKPIRQEINSLIVRGAWSGVGMAKEINRHCDRLWTFVDVEGVEPTNNASERALRHAVIWRKLSFGTQSKDGSRFVETLLTIVETCRQQSRQVFPFLTAAIQHKLLGNPPQLLARA